jgi:hypothetical protein
MIGRKKLKKDSTALFEETIRRKMSNKGSQKKGTVKIILN